jgi:hypothetical protein
MRAALLVGAGCDNGAAPNSDTCGNVDFCIPFLSADTHSFSLCASPEAQRSEAGAAYHDCVVAAAQSTACQTACNGPLRTDMGSPCGQCAYAACADVRARCHY